MLLLLLAGAGFFYLLQHIIYRKYWNAGLAITVNFEARSSYEGDFSYLREEITNDKPLPLPALEVNLAMDFHGRRSSAAYLSGVKREDTMRLHPPM